MLHRNQEGRDYETGKRSSAIISQFMHAQAIKLQH